MEDGRNPLCRRVPGLIWAIEVLPSKVDGLDTGFKGDIKLLNEEGSYHEEEQHPILKVINEAFLFLIEIVEESVSIFFFTIYDEQNTHVILDKLLGKTFMMLIIFFSLFWQYLC